MKKRRIITITMDIDMKTHKGEMVMEITENGERKDEFSVAEVLSIVSVLGHYEQEFLVELRNKSVKDEFKL